MGKGLIRANLAALRTRTWTVDGQPLTGEAVVRFFLAIEAGDLEPHLALDPTSNGSSRHVDRARRILKDAGLIRYVPAGRRWVAAGTATREGT